MSGSGMIAARPEGLAVDCSDRPDPLWEGVGHSDDDMQQALAVQARLHALGILMLGATKCTEVGALADSGRIDRDGADLFIRRYSESICEIVAELMPVRA